MDLFALLRAAAPDSPGARCACVRSPRGPSTSAPPPLGSWMAPRSRGPPVLARWCLRLVFVLLLCGLAFSTVCDLAACLARIAAASPTWLPPRGNTCGAALWPLPHVTLAAAEPVDGAVLPSCVAADGRQTKSLPADERWSCTPWMATRPRGGVREIRRSTSVAAFAAPTIVLSSSLQAERRVVGDGAAAAANVSRAFGKDRSALAAEAAVAATKAAADPQYVAREAAADGTRVVNDFTRLLYAKVAPMVLFVEPAGAIGYGATLSPLVVIGLFSKTLKYVYVDGVSILDAQQPSPYELRLPFIPAYPAPPHVALLHCGNGLLPDCEDSLLARPLTITITYVAAANRSDSTHAAVAPLLANVTVVLDGLDGRPLLARYPTFTPLLLSSSTHALVMTRPPRFTSDTELDKWSVAPSYRQPPTQRHQLSAVVHPQQVRIVGQAQQDWEANISRFSVQLAAHTFADALALVGVTAAVEQVLPASAAPWWMDHSIRVEYRNAAKDAMQANVSILWTVGEVTGDLTTTTATRSLDVAAELYGLHVVLPSLTRAAHTVTLPALYDVAPGDGVRFMNQNCTAAPVTHDLFVRGAFPRSLLILNDDVMATLRPLRVPTFEGTTTAPNVALVDPTLGDCQATGESDVGDTLFCRASVRTTTRDDSALAELRATDPLDTCGGGIVVGLFSASGSTASEASGAATNWDAESSGDGLTLLSGFPKALALTSRVGLQDVFNAMPNLPTDMSTFEGEWLVLRFSFVFLSAVSGVYRLHCDGSALHMQVSIRAGSDPDTVVQADCLQRPTDAAPFRHTVVDAEFDSESRLYINASCTFPWVPGSAPGSPTGEFCGVSLEAVSLRQSLGPAMVPLPSYAVYEMRVPVNEDAAAAADGYAVALGLGEAAATPLASFTLPGVGSVRDCYALPWRVLDEGGPYESGAAVGQRWGGLGFVNVSFPSTVVSETGEAQQYCHLFLALRLPEELQSAGATATTAAAQGGGSGGVGRSAGAAQCPPLLTLTVQTPNTSAAPVQTQRVFCGSRSYFMDPITPLQLRVPLLEVPRLVDLDALVPSTEDGYMVYQYCIEVVFYDETTRFTAAYAAHRPLVYTIVDTVDAPSHFCPSVQATAPPNPANVSALDTVYFTGTDLRYYNASNARPLTGARFTVELVTVGTYKCADAGVMTPTGVLPSLTAYLVNDTTVALPITADVPGGWFNLTMAQGEAGAVVVDCSVTLRVASTIDSVTASDVVGPVGGTVLRVRGSNLPIFEATDATLTVGYPGESGTPTAPRCRVTSSSGTLIECTTPSIDEDRIPTLAIYHEEDENEDTYWLPLNLTIFYVDSRKRRRMLQTININNTATGVSALLVPFRLSKMSITSVSPLRVSCMSDNLTFTVRGTGIASHSVLLCDVTTISTADRTSCILCLPRAFSSELLVCDALSSLPQGYYRVYVSDRALEGVTAFTVASSCRVDTVEPAFLYPHTGSVQLSLIGDGFAPSSAAAMSVVATSGGTQRTYVRPIVAMTSTKVTCDPPDLRWMEESGGTLALAVIFGGGGVLGCGGQCSVREARVLPSSQVPRIHSVTPFAGQAPLLLTVYGAGFTKLPHSPRTPQSVISTQGGLLHHTTPLALQDTYIDVGGGSCIIVGMLNTRIVCNLTDPCANTYVGSAVHLVSRTYGTTTPFSGNTSRLFFQCDMRVDAISHATGSAAGGQTLLVTGVGFPAEPALLKVTVAGVTCTVQVANTTSITCTTVATYTAMAPRNGPVVVLNRGTGRQSSCCSYTFDATQMPMLTSVSPMTAAAGARLLLFGVNFPNATAAAGAPNGDGSSGGNLPLWGTHTINNPQTALMTVLFGTRQLDVTDIKSSTRAFVTVPDDFFGQDYLAVHVNGVGNSPHFMGGLFTVLATPAVAIPGMGGFHGRVTMRLAGTSLGPNRAAAEVTELFNVFVCGRLCEMLPTGSAGEVTCRTPTYIDVEFVSLYRRLLAFERLTDGFTAYIDGAAAGDWGAVNTVNDAPNTLVYSMVPWGDVTALFTGSASVMHPFAASASVVSIVRPSVFIVLEAHLHSRLLLSSVTLVLAPMTPQVNSLDLSQATCRLLLATTTAEYANLFSSDANPLNTTMWQQFDSGSAAAAHFAWPPLQLGANTLNFTLLDALPTAVYIGIECVGLPVNVLQLSSASVAGYQVGLDFTGGVCPVNIRAQQRSDQPIMDSCPQRDGVSCPLFRYRREMTPVVTRYDPVSALASDVGAYITLYGSGFGTNVTAIESVVLDRAACAPVSVSDTELRCAMQGRVSTTRPWRVAWSNESGRGTAMLLSTQPFYAAVAWSSYLAWMGEGLPKEGNIIVIPPGNSILLDVPPPPLSGLLLSGVLIVSDNLDIELRVGYMLIAETGALIAGSPSQPHRHRFTLTLALNLFQDNPYDFVNDIASLEGDAEPPYSRLLNVMGGTLQLHGTPPAMARARLAQTANIGDTSITIDRWVPWAVGDVVAIVTKHVALPHFIEQRTIVARVANATNTVLFFTSEAPLAHLHRAGAPMPDEPAASQYADAVEWNRTWAGAYAEATGTEVVYLTRTIVVRGDEVSPLSGVGASVWIQGTTKVRLEHVELYRTGKRGTLQGYSVWLDGVRFPVGEVVLDDIVLHDAYYRGVVLQNTRNVILRAVTVLYADGYGVAAAGPEHARLAVVDSFLAGLRGGRGGLDTIAAGLFASAADVALQGTEIFASEGHGAWYALRFLFAGAPAWLCPGQSVLAGLHDSRLHNLRRHGVLVYPLQLNVGERCVLSTNAVDANEPSATSAAAQSASAEDRADTQLAGAMRGLLIFSCGLYGVYLPPSTGYEVRDSAIVDCGVAGVFMDYTTVTTYIKTVFVAGRLPEGLSTTEDTLAGTNNQDDHYFVEGSIPLTEAAEALSLSPHQCAIAATHGGHFALDSISLGSVTGGAALMLGTLSVSSSVVTDYLPGSYAAQRSAHLTARVFNISVVQPIAAALLLTGSVAVIDLDGRLAASDERVIFLFGESSDLVNAPARCVLVPETAPGSTSEVLEPPLSVGVGRLVAESPQRAGQMLWMQGREVASAGISGTTVVRLTAPTAREPGDEHSGSLGGPQSQMWGCKSPAKMLSLMFLEASTAADPVEGETPAACTTVTADLREGDGTRTVLQANLTRLNESSGSASGGASGGASDSSAGATAVEVVASASFYLMSRDDEPTNGQSRRRAERAAGIAAAPRWYTPSASYSTAGGVEELRGAGAYTLESSTNLSLTFYTETGAVCYPAKFTMRADQSLAWPTAELLTQVRVSQSTYAYGALPGLRTACTAPPLMGDVRWRFNSSDPGVKTRASRATASAASSTQSSREDGAAEESEQINTTALLLANAERPTWLTLALNPPCIGALNRSGDSGPWPASPSLWAAVEVRVCREITRAGDDCIGPRFPYLEPFVSARTVAANAPFVSWYSSAAWEDGWAPWLVSAATATATTSAFVIPFGTRVHLHLRGDATVPGVLLVVGELLVTVGGDAASPSSKAHTSSMETNWTAASTAGTPAACTLRVTSLVVLGKLNVSATEDVIPVLRIELGIEHASTPPYQLDADTSVYPGTLYAAGEVLLTGVATRPTTWRATEAVPQDTHLVPAVQHLMNVSVFYEYCMQQVQLMAAVTSTPPQTLLALSTAVSNCAIATFAHLPRWLSRITSPYTSVAAWRNGSRIGVTSGTAFANQSETNTVLSSGGAAGSATFTAASAWRFPHGGVYTHDATPRMEGLDVYGELVQLSQTVELDCAIAKSLSDAGCMLHITRQRNPAGLFQPPRFQATGVGIRRFGKRGQRTASARVMPAAAPLTFLPAVYVNVSAGDYDAGPAPASFRTTAEDWDAAGYAVLAGTVLENSYGTALYSDRKNTHLFMVDSAVWNSVGGGVRIDGGASGVFMAGVVVAGTTYARGRDFGNVTDERELIRPDPATLAETPPLTLEDTLVTSMCSVLVNQSSVLWPSRTAEGEGDLSVSEVVTVGAFVQDVVAAGSESEGFCVPWDSPGGPRWMARNTAHSAVIGLFLFDRMVSPEPGTQAQTSADNNLATQRSFTPGTNQSTWFDSPLGGGTPLSGAQPAFDLFTPSNNELTAITQFSQWTIYGNRYIGIYSSGHSNVSITASDIFANPIGVALAVNPATSVGNSSILDSYIATFPGCSCGSTTYSNTYVGLHVPPAVAAASVREWDVCQYSAYAESRWTPYGCGPLTFVDETYHYTAVLVMPSYAYRPLSYPRDAPITSLSASVVESHTQSSLFLTRVLFGAVGDLAACTSTACWDAVGAEGSPLRSAAVMGTGGPGLRGSASLGAVVLSAIAYASSSASSLAKSTIAPRGANVSAFLPVTGTAASVLRLRPHTLKPSVHGSVKGDAVAYPTELGTASPGSGNDGTAAPAEDVVQAGRENPYGDTVVYDSDDTAYTKGGGGRNYIARSAWSNNSVTTLLSTLCTPDTTTDGEMFVCDQDITFVQVRFRSLDARAGLQSLVGRLSLFLAEAPSADAAQYQNYYTPTAMSVLRARDTEQPGSAGDSAATVLAFPVPFDVVVLQPAAEAYPQAMEVQLAACDDAAVGATRDVLVALPLLDNQATVRVWSVRSRVLMPVASSLTAFHIVNTSVGSAYDLNFPIVDEPGTVENAAQWIHYSNQSNITGDTASLVLLQLHCGARLRVHQLVYGMIMLYAPQDLNLVKQGLLRNGLTVDVSSILPAGLYPTVNMTWFVERLLVTVMDLYPDAVLGEGTWIVLKVEAVDSFEYNITAAADAINEFFSVVDSNSTFFNSFVAAPAAASLAAAQDELRERLLRVTARQRPGPASGTRLACEMAESGEDPAASVEAAAFTGATLVVGGVHFSVVLTMPVLLPAELARLQAILRAFSAAVEPGTVSTSALVVFIVVVSLVLLLLAAWVGLRLCLPALRWRRDAAVAAAARKTAGAPHTAAAAVLGTRDDDALPQDTGSAGVVWVAGVLRTAVVATLDKNGVTACGGADAVHRRTAKTAMAAAATPAHRAASRAVTRQLLLLPSFDPLDKDAAAVPFAASDAPVPRVTEPQRSHAAARQRYVRDWHIAPHAMVALTQRNSMARVMAMATTTAAAAATAAAGGRGVASTMGSDGSAEVASNAGSPTPPPQGTPGSRPRRPVPPSSNGGSAGAAAYGSRVLAEGSYRTSLRPQDGNAAAAGQSPVSTEPAIPVAPQLPPPSRVALSPGALLPPAAIGGGAVADGGIPAQAQAQTAALPMTLQSILTTSALTSSAALPYASPASLFPTGPTTVDDTTQVLRGRGQILFTTPTVDSASAVAGSSRRALRLAMNAVLTPGDSSADDEDDEEPRQGYERPD